MFCPFKMTCELKPYVCSIALKTLEKNHTDLFWEGKSMLTIDFLVVSEPFVIAVWPRLHLVHYLCDVRLLVRR